MLRLFHLCLSLPPTQNIGQNLPDVAHSLVRMQVNASLKAEIAAFQQTVPPGTNIALLNGVPLDLNADLFKLLDLAQRESEYAEALSAAKLPEGARKALLKIHAPDLVVRLAMR